MTTTKSHSKILLSILTIILAFCLAISAPIVLKSTVSALDSYTETVTVNNGDFNSSSSIALQATPSSWSRLGSTTGKSGVINVKDENFSNRASTYGLTNVQNPQKPYVSTNYPLDDNILMLNAKSSNTTNEKNHNGYSSSNIKLSSYSFYKISVWVNTQTSAFASIYLNGITDDNASFERIEATSWTEYRIYIATGYEEQTINIELWLGTKTLDSYNAVFFDHVTMFQLSNNYFADEAKPEQNVKVVDFRNYTTPLVENADFETGNLQGWSIIDYLPIDANANVTYVKSNAALDNLGFYGVGNDLFANNNYALALHTSKDAFETFGVESTAFTLKPYEMYKITISAKVSNTINSAFFVLKEQDDVKDFYGKLTTDFYTPIEEKIEITTNDTNSFNNGYSRYSFYVRGHELFETTVKLQLWMGKEDVKASGAVVFDNITFEKISSKQFSNAGTTNTKKVTLTTITAKPTITNGTFNEINDIEADASYPYSPINFAHQTSSVSKTEYGVINTYDPLYDDNKANWGSVPNPKNPAGALDTSKDTNNMLMLWNKFAAYQSVTSDSFSLAANSYQKISFDFKTIKQESGLNADKMLYVYILDSDGNILFADEGLSSQNWTNYQLVIKSNDYTTSLKLKIALGSEENELSAYMFIDNLKFNTDETMTDETYKEYANTHKTLDFAPGNFNLISQTQTNAMYTPYRYTRSLDSGNNPPVGNPKAYGGIISGKDNIFGISNSPNNENILDYMPAIRVDGKSTYSLTSKDGISLSSETYYKISIDVYTRFSGNTEQPGVKDEEKAKFGASFGISGLENMFKEIKTNGEWQTYTLYVKTTEAVTGYLKFALTSESEDIIGKVFFDAYKFETIEAEEFEVAETQAKTNPKLLVVGNVIAEEPPAEDDKDKEPNAFWYIIPSLITALALIIALITYFMKKIKIKKWEKTKQSEYDRDKTLHRDALRLEAEQRRDAEIKTVMADIEQIRAEANRIEEIRKENVKQQRASDRTITRQDEREFKAYVARRAKLENSISALESHIEKLNSAEYLLSLQKRIVSEKINALKAEKEKNK